MHNKPIRLPWGKQSIDLELSLDWQITGILEPSALPGVMSLENEISHSLTNPVASRRLSELVDKNSKVALVMDDLSRPTPVAKLLPSVLNELKSGGVVNSQITLIPALGVHRPMHEKKLQFAPD